MTWDHQKSVRYIFDSFRILLFGPNLQKLNLSNLRKGLPGGRVIKNPPANAGDARDTGSIPGSERTLGVENANNNKKGEKCGRG